jgi:hypothetical protein
MGFKPRTDFCRNKEGYLIGNKEGIKIDGKNTSRIY